MSDNIPLPSVEEVNEWTPDKVNAFLGSHKEKLSLRDQDIKIIEDNWIRGSAFLKLNVDKLMYDGLKRGPAETIAELIEKIKGEEQGKYHDCIRIFQTYTAFSAIISSINLGLIRLFYYIVIYYTEKFQGLLIYVALLTKGLC